MCWKCELVAQIEKARQTHGHFIMQVAGGEDDPSFMYTVGNFHYGLPEILVMLASPGVGHLINAACLEHRRRGGFKDGDEWRWEDARNPVRFVKIDRDLDDHTHWVANTKGDRDYEVLQMLIPDREGRWPGDPECDPIFDTEVLR